VRELLRVGLPDRSEKVVFRKDLGTFGPLNSSDAMSLDAVHMDARGSRVRVITEPLASVFIIKITLFYFQRTSLPLVRPCNFPSEGRWHEQAQSEVTTIPKAQWTSNRFSKIVNQAIPQLYLWLPLLNTGSQQNSI
jgi:hypothetical protein